ncbi:FAD-dependent 5-carboxymethylaminomethyl-2-thiouridine(34) oxidoreductase MnmC [Phenylobacterium deserti]|uniref:tRNA 5-methylaminomethyl-2-thiouridine biosynthesis bifunctional protein MnmC n=1 Tax=Phenylobacterium deserti TaxID=1914756 RepID=A0A328APR6_9CAUL|nr:FAD-dependent 5-carboxymethylaminomethyl-2-thiouridine(34) oxidoreductase MnmC [Phenylobacterium deserti]RAK57003.1 FAD-dependent cmnm(5)s(2)U34 oxidoreductase [Phenylobacterium deserti]
MSEPSSPQSPLDWSEDGQPRSRLYGDVYFSREDGLAESRAVFLQGCGLPQAWAGRTRFTVGELGFGTGLNILALLDLWRREGPAAGRLHVFTVEAHPITGEEAARALAHWPELADLAALLVARWPGQARGVHRVELPELRAIIDVAVLDVVEALSGWSGRADAWFLDGFSPARNPAMWSDEVLALVGARTAPGAPAATFTVAGQVRRGLSAAGFEVAKRPGFGRKRERLEARFPGAPPADAPAPAVAVIGAGIAGASAVRALRALGLEPLLFEADRLGAGGSGNPAALVTPRLDAGLGPPARLFAQAFARAVQLYEAVPDAVIARGVLQLAGSARDEDRFARIAASDLFEPGALSPLDASEASRRLGAAAPSALAQDAALTVRPDIVLQAFAGKPARARIASIAHDGHAWRLADAQGQTLAQVDAVILAAGLGAAALADAPLQPVRGQASWVEGASIPEAVAWGGYAAPIDGGVLFGATHDRDDAGDDLRDDDHRRNLATLATALPNLAQALEGRPLAGRAAVRAASPDRLPLAGPAPSAPPGLFLLTAFGSRGFSFAPLLAEHVAALACGAPSPLPASLATLVAPERFRLRAIARGHS